MILSALFIIALTYCFASTFTAPISALQKVDDIILKYSSLPACTFQFLQIDLVLLCQ